ncbi:hypothetical protein PG993_006301 [Apiospora rasikravindrae]|uniref:Uncharacterized protein n=1 Tax=Apiospora rasikravindrae TaxID=990691 RepID=A0ABR1T7S9_9PEZI
MRASTVFATLAATVAASPVATRAADYQWDVTEWDAGCNNEGCTYQFQIAGAATSDYPARPAFSATCAGQSFDGKVYSEYADCKLDSKDTKGSLVSRLNKPEQLLGSRTVIPVQVSFQFADLNQDNTYWNYTGVANTTFNRGGAPPQSFAIIPKESFGIA